MRHYIGTVLAIFVLAAATARLEAVPTELGKDAYDRAAAALPQNVGKLIRNASLTPHWAEEGNLFWYKRAEETGHGFWLVDPEAATQALLFDHDALASQLAANRPPEADNAPITASQLPIQITRLSSDGNTLEFNYGNRAWTLDRATGRLAVKDQPAADEETSPDGKWRVLSRDHNLVLVDSASGEETLLTTDGAACHAYGEPMPTPADVMARQTPAAEDRHADVFWAPDSSRFLTYRIDCRTTGTLTLVQSTPEHTKRPKSVTYPYPLTGDSNVPMARLFSVDPASGKVTPIDLAPFPELYYGGPWLGWAENNRHAAIRIPDRGYKSLKLVEIDAVDGSSKVLIENTDPDFVDYYAHRWHPSPETQEHYWSSEESGWAHLQRYDGQTGKTNQITSGDWRFRYIERVGTRDEPLLIVAAGREAGRDPYLRHLYRVGRDGQDLTLLTPEALDHGVSASPDGRYFVDNMSLANVPTRSVLRDTQNGTIVMTLQEADVSAFANAGIPFPEPFQAKAADGTTDIYGVIYRPSGFDPSKNYPVIDNIYRGPHYVMAAKSFDRATRNTAIAMAQLGFIVVQVDGRGTNKRDLSFLKPAYKNLGPVGFDDHVAAFRQLAERYPSFDLERVGIYGFSAGGYDAMRALLEYPDFYKAAVSASGNHDSRLDKAVWNEQWMGTELGPHYDANSNLFGLERMKGALMLAHGEMDENVHPMATMQLVDALIKANKNFDLLIVPGAGHFLDDVPYFQRRRWDFFVRHLMRLDPPANYHLEYEGPSY